MMPARKYLSGAGPASWPPTSSPSSEMKLWPSTVARNCSPCSALQCTVVTGRRGSPSLRARRWVSCRVAMSFKLASTLNMLASEFVPELVRVGNISIFAFLQTQTWINARACAKNPESISHTPPALPDAADGRRRQSSRTPSWQCRREKRCRAPSERTDRARPRESEPAAARDKDSAAVVDRRETARRNGPARAGRESCRRLHPPVECREASAKQARNLARRTTSGAAPDHRD